MDVLSLIQFDIDQVEIFMALARVHGLEGHSFYETLQELKDAHIHKLHAYEKRLGWDHRCAAYLQ